MKTMVKFALNGLCSRYQTQLEFAVQEQWVNGRRHNVFVAWEELLLGPLYA